jgi:hypothetical protein
MLLMTTSWSADPTRAWTPFGARAQTAYLVVVGGTIRDFEHSTFWLPLMEIGRGEFISISGRATSGRGAKMETMAAAHGTGQET